MWPFVLLPQTSGASNHKAGRVGIMRAVCYDIITHGSHGKSSLNWDLYVVTLALNFRLWKFFMSQLKFSLFFLVSGVSTPSPPSPPSAPPPSQTSCKISNYSCEVTVVEYFTISMWVSYCRPLCPVFPLHVSVKSANFRDRSSDLSLLPFRHEGMWISATETPGF